MSLHSSLVANLGLLDDFAQSLAVALEVLHLSLGTALVLQPHPLNHDLASSLGAKQEAFWALAARHAPPLAADLLGVQQVTCAVLVLQQNPHQTAELGALQAASSSQALVVSLARTHDLEDPDVKDALDHVVRGQVAAVVFRGLSVRQANRSQKTLCSRTWSFYGRARLSPQPLILCAFAAQF